MAFFRRKAGSKYFNKSVVRYWIKFASTSEADYYDYLVAQWVKELKVHPPYILMPAFTYHWKNILKTGIVADFSYIKDWKEIVIDIKWEPTETALLKRKMFMYLYPDKELLRITTYNWKRVDYDDNETRKAENRRKKKLALKKLESEKQTTQDLWIFSGDLQGWWVVERKSP